MNNSFNCDVGIIGAGPAGCSTALRLARDGATVIIFERERFPRFHIGESLLATTNDCFDELGLTERIRAANFPEKLGAHLSLHNMECARIVDFAESREIRRPQTFQVCREKFDSLLLEAVREAGVAVLEAHRVSECSFDEDGVSIHYSDPTDAPHLIRTRAVVDASGRYGLLARKFSLRCEEPLLANIAIFAHYSGVPKLPQGRANDIRIVARDDSGWFWVIPIDDRLTSVGVVLPKALYRKRANGSPEEMLHAAFQDTPTVAALMKEAKREWPVRVEKEFSYGTAAYAGDRWLLVGDAGSFLDPVFSTGVSIALESGIEAARALKRPLLDNKFQRSRFARFEKIQRRRFSVFRRMVLSFYTPHFRDLFFQPKVPEILFRAVVTILAGKWNPSIFTRLLLSLFYGFVRIQRHHEIVPRLADRKSEAGYPTR